MIVVDLPARMECVEEDCTAGLGVALVLTAGGTLVGQLPNGHGWQLAVLPNGVLQCRCPRHHAVIEDTKPRLVGVPH